MPAAQPADRPLGGQHVREGLGRRRRLETALVTADAPRQFPGLGHRAAAHGLHHHPVLIQQLEVHETARRDLEVGRPVRLDSNRAKDALVLETVPVHGRSVYPLAAPRRPRPETLLGRLHHPKRLDRPALHPFHVRSTVHIRHEEASGTDGELTARRDHRRARCRRDRHRVEAPGGFRVQKELVAEDVDQIQPHLLSRLRTGRLGIGPQHAGTQEVLAGAVRCVGVEQRERVLVLRSHTAERVPVPLAYAIDRLLGPGPYDRTAAIHSEPAINDRQRTPRTVMTRPEDAHYALRPGDGTRVDDTPGRRRIVPPVDSVVRAVRVDRPQALCVTEVAVHVLPAVVENAAVRQKRPVPLEQRALPDLVDVGAVRRHAEQVRHDVAVAHAVLRLPTGGKNDRVIGEVQRVNVRNSGRRRKLAQVRPITVDLVEMVVVADSPPHREDDLAAAEVDLGVADHAVGQVQERSRPAFAG